MLIKLSSNLDWDWGHESVQIITDPRQLTKSAAAPELLDYEKTAGQADLLIVALGAYEGTGFNRNADAFSEEDCIKNAHWFVDSGTFDKKANKWDGRSVHRHHKNKPESPKYGTIKKAFFNPTMRRIEQIIGLDIDKCADILDEQEKKGQTNWSMASKQAYDICSWCDHRAKNDSDRCECVRTKLGEINKEGKMCGMHNPNPRWFEQSYVHRPADRIGMSLKSLTKEANYKIEARNTFKLGNDFYVPEEPTETIISKKASEKRTLLIKLAELEKRVEGIARGANRGKDKFIEEHAAKLNASEGLSSTTIEELRKQDPHKLLKVMADAGIVLGPEDFVQYLFGGQVKGDSVKGMKQHLPDIFGELESDDDSKGEAVNSERFEPSGSNSIPKELKELIGKLVGDHSIFGQPAHCRVVRITIMGRKPKALDAAPAKEERSKEAFDKGLAKVYAQYKLAALNYLDENNKLDEETLLNAVIQNRR